MKLSSLKTPDAPRCDYLPSPTPQEEKKQVCHRSKQEPFVLNEKFDLKEVFYCTVTCDGQRPQLSLEIALSMLHRSLP